MTKRETVPEALEKWAKIKPDQLVWQFHNSKTEIEESYTFKVCVEVVLSSQIHTIRLFICFLCLCVVGA